MASSRVMRKSPRNASPLTSSTQVQSTTEVQKPEVEATPSLDEPWVEPPVRPPGPSWEDNPGLEKNPACDHMQALGQMPSQRVRLRVKGLDYSRRSALPKKVESLAPSKEVVKAPEVITTRRRSESRKLKAPPSPVTTFSAQEHDAHVDKPKTTPAGAASPKHSTRRPLFANIGTPSSKTSEGREKLRTIVNSTVTRAREIGNEILGLAVQRLFEESLNDPDLADLLDSVLFQRQSERQAADFQAYIKIARKNIKLENSLNAQSQLSPSITAPIFASTTTSLPAATISPLTTTTLSHAASATTSSPMTAQPPVTRQPSVPIGHRDHTPTAEKRTNGKMAEMNGASDDSPPAKRIKRTSSRSSTSSLSSLASDDPAMELDQDARATTSGPDSNTQTSAGPKLHTFSTKSSKKSSKKKRTASNRQSAAPTTPTEEPFDAEVAEKKRKLRKSFDDVPVKISHMRTPTLFHQPSPETRRNSAASLPYQASGLANVTNVDDEPLSSASSFHGDNLLNAPPLGGATRSSRGPTPNGLGRPKATEMKQARFKLSPTKKKSGGIAGIARTGGGRRSPVGHEDDTDEAGNVDYCSNCKNEGYLLCCDGCEQAFHLRCLEPPMKHAPTGSWKCLGCKGIPGLEEGRTIMSNLLFRMKKRNPKRYALPGHIRNYFEGVTEDDDGEFNEKGVRELKRHTFGNDENYDTLKLKDSKGNFVLCQYCGKSSLGGRQIIQCDYCPLRWHLDCLEPPMANVPTRDIYGRQKYTWMCPMHLEKHLCVTNPKGSGRLFKLRRPKNPMIVESYLQRGIKNNGIIEIVNDDGDEDDASPSNNVVYSLKASAIKLDFIDRAKRERDALARQSQQAAQNAREQEVQALAMAEEQRRAFNARNILEKQAAMHLAQFAQQNPDLGLSVDGVQTLLNTLISEAPSAVVALTSAEEAIKGTDVSVTTDHSVPPTPPTSDLQDRAISAVEKRQLLMMQELIRRRLEDTEATENTD